MVKALAFETYVLEYDSWYDRHKAIFNSEVEALREMLPPGESKGIEVGVGTGRFALALGIKEGVEPMEAMRSLAMARKIDVRSASAEHLPYKDLQFDFVIMAYCISYIKDLHAALKEANRVLKHNGSLIVGFIDKNSPIGKFYIATKSLSLFHKQATFYTAEKVVEELKRAGFSKFKYAQTLFGNLDEITQRQPTLPGYGRGSYVIIKAQK